MPRRRNNTSGYDFDGLAELTSIDELRAAREDLSDYGQTVSERAERGDSLPDGEVRKVTDALSQLDERIEKTELRLASFRSHADLMDRTGGTEDERSVNRHERRTTRTEVSPLKGALGVRSDESVTEWAQANGHIAERDSDVNFGRYLRGVVSGEWAGAEAERALSEGTFSAGGALVPTPLATVLIDAARNKAVVSKVGATVFPMTSQTLRVPRLVSEAAPIPRAENAPVAVGDLAFDQVTFVARSVDRIILLSRELFEDSDPSAAAIIESSFASQFALELDRIALFGSGTAPESRGLVNTPGITTVTHGANGAALSYDFLIDAATAVRENNFEPNFHIVAPKTRGALQKSKNSQGDYLTPPPDLLPIYDTKNVATGVTTGTSTDATSIITGAGQLLGIGIRTSFSIRVLHERYADTQQVGILANMRFDVQLLQPKAFVLDTGVRVS